MKALLVNGSPHWKGCTDTALRLVGETLKMCGVDCDMFWIGNHPIAGCLGCHTCAKKNHCVFSDKVNDFLDIAGDYDAFVFGTPVHYAAASGAMTSFLDRVFYADLNGGGNRFRLKPAAAVISARRAGTTSTWDQINKYFGLMEMPIVTSRYWNQVYGTTPEEVLKDAEGVQTMRILGRNIAYLMKAMAIAKKEGLLPPEKEKGIHLNFIREDL